MHFHSKQFELSKEFHFYKMSSDVVRWLAIDNKCKNERRDHCNSQLHDRKSDSVVKSIVLLKLVFLVVVINFNIGLVLADKDVHEPDDDGYGHYTPHWAVHMPDVSEETAQRVADEHGFIYLGKVSIKSKILFSLISITLTFERNSCNDFYLIFHARFISEYFHGHHKYFVLNIHK